MKQEAAVECVFLVPVLSNWFHTTQVFPQILPAIQAVMKHATVPEIKARTATDAISPFLVGAMLLRAANIIPTEDRLAKPQRAYVAMTSERSCKQLKKMKKDKLSPVCHRQLF